MGQASSSAVRLYYRFMRYLCQMAFVLLWRGRVFGRHRFPREGGVLLIGNHQSFLDPVLVTMALHREGNYMARDSLFARPLFRALIVSLNAFPVRRGAADLSAVKELIRRLRAGAVVVAFPEGTRTPDGSIGEMRPGPFLAAQRAGCAIVPVVIDGAYEAWPRHQPFPAPRPIRVAYGEPISPHDVQSMLIDDLIAEVRRRLLALQRARQKS
jgi:1-acyl-sn-glycerol-3-phosphate acyltransferase